MIARLRKLIGDYKNAVRGHVRDLTLIRDQNIKELLFYKDFPESFAFAFRQLSIAVINFKISFWKTISGEKS